MDRHTNKPFMVVCIRDKTEQGEHMLSQGTGWSVMALVYNSEQALSAQFQKMMVNFGLGIFTWQIRLRLME